MASERALELAAQAWCTDKNSGKVMDPDLAEAFAEILDKSWQEEREVLLAKMRETVFGLGQGTQEVSNVPSK
jgi:hypothetical protein